MDAATADPTGSTAADHIETAGTREDPVPSPESLIPIPEHRIPESENELPNPLQHLITTAGIKLVSAPCGTWNIDGIATKLHRPFLVTFSVDADVTSDDVLNAVCDTGVAAEITSIQFRGSNRSWCVSFPNPLKIVSLRGASSLLMVELSLLVTGTSGQPSSRSTRPRLRCQTR